MIQVGVQVDVHRDYIQNKFDAWKAPKRIEDNMSQGMRKALKNLNNEISTLMTNLDVL